MFFYTSYIYTTDRLRKLLAFTFCLCIFLQPFFMVSQHTNVIKVPIEECPMEQSNYSICHYRQSVYQIVSSSDVSDEAGTGWTNCCIPESFGWKIQFSNHPNHPINIDYPSMQTFFSPIFFLTLDYSFFLSFVLPVYQRNYLFLLRVFDLQETRIH